MIDLFDQTIQFIVQVDFQDILFGTEWLVFIQLSSSMRTSPKQRKKLHHQFQRIRT
jgi:hypothetical protein